MPTKISKHPDPNRHGIQKRNILWIWVAVNRNLNIPKTQILCDPRRSPTLDRFLDHVTQTLSESGLGLVRCLCLANDGSCIKELSELRDGELYVACGSSRFKRMDYTKAVDYQEREKNYIQPDLNAMKAKFTSSDDGPSIFERHKEMSALLIYLVYNGDSSGNFKQLLLTKRDRTSLTSVLNAVTAKMQDILKYSNAHDLFQLDGTRISSIDQIKDARDGGVYVVVDRFPLKIPSIRFENNRLVAVDHVKRFSKPEGSPRKNAQDQGNYISNTETPIRSQDIPATTASDQNGDIPSPYNDGTIDRNNAQDEDLTPSQDKPFVENDNARSSKTQNTDYTTDNGKSKQAKQDENCKKMPNSKAKEEESTVEKKKQSRRQPKNSDAKQEQDQNPKPSPGTDTLKQQRIAKNNEIQLNHSPQPIHSSEKPLSLPRQPKKQCRKTSSERNHASPTRIQPVHREELKDAKLPKVTNVHLSQKETASSPGQKSPNKPLKQVLTKTPLSKHEPGYQQTHKRNSDKLKPDQVSRKFDRLIPNILNFVLNQEDERSWQTRDKRAKSAFLNALKAARNGELGIWEKTPKSLAALLALLDQVPRNLGHPAADIYAIDKLSCEVLLRSMERGVFNKLSPLYKLLSAFVLSRQENIQHQDMCLKIWNDIRNKLPPHYHTAGDMLVSNHEVIAKFNRFPGRNDVLGRKTTRAEKRFLAAQQKAKSDVIFLRDPSNTISSITFHESEQGISCDSYKTTNESNAKGKSQRNKNTDGKK